MAYTIKGLKGGELYYATKHELHAAIGGMKHALFAFSYWKGNKLYVGNGEREYIDVVKELEDAYKEATGIAFNDDSFYVSLEDDL